jgi:hypothetical protein
MYILSVTAVQIGAQVWQNPTRTITGGLGSSSNTIGPINIGVAALSSWTALGAANAIYWFNLIVWNSSSAAAGRTVNNSTTSMETGTLAIGASESRFAVITANSGVGVVNHDSTITMALSWVGSGYIN